MSKFKRILYPSIFMTAFLLNLGAVIAFDINQAQASIHSSEPQCEFTQQTNSDFPSMTHSFFIKEYPINHQGNNRLNISVSFTDQNDDLTKEAKTIDAIHAQIKDFFTNYPDEWDFWEVLNQKLVKAIFASHPVMSYITIKLEVLPTEKFPNIRTTTVTLTDKQQLFGNWDFAINDHPIEHKGKNILDIDAEYTYYYEGVQNSEYIDYKKVRARIIQFLAEYPQNNDSWDVVNENLAKVIFEENQALSTLNLTLKIQPNYSYPYWRSTSTMLNRCLQNNIENKKLKKLGSLPMIKVTN